MRLVFAGSPAVALPSLRLLLDESPHEVVAVLTRPDAPAGRGRRLRPSAVAELARDRDLPVLAPARVGDPAFLAELAALEPDCCPVVAYGALLPRSALDVPRHGWVNLHFSLLPAWRGAAPVQHAVLHGDHVTGATTFLIEEGLDSGPVYGTVTEEVRPRDTAGDLLARLAVAGARLLGATLDAIADGSARPVGQQEHDVSAAPRLTAADSRVDWAVPAFAVDRRVRAMTPEPGAWTLFRGAHLGIGPVTVAAPDEARPAPGEVVVERRRVLVGTATGPVVLGDVAGQGRRRMPAVDWARGARPTPGERLG